MKAWAEVFPHVNGRSRKPRAQATMIIDRCMGLTNMADLLELTGDFADHWKLSFGTSALLGEDILRRKIKLARDNDLLVYPGGTLAEYAILKGVYPEYIARACQLGFNGVEISDGTIHLPAENRRDAIRFALDAGLTVVSEVGKKDPREQPSAAKLAQLALADFEVGSSWVIIEARESGKGVGIYSKEGDVHEDDVNTIVAALNGHLERLIWEAPLKNQQEYFILRFGPDVGLGNIQPNDLLATEALRAGLRFETLRPVVERMEQEEPRTLAERISHMLHHKVPEA
ncbi:MAG: phosphosulfolactate synthase [Chloroflexi bacterium]|nr:phosphosulfolactate synthase [Chloroflexota bacterium]